MSADRGFRRPFQLLSWVVGSSGAGALTGLVVGFFRPEGFDLDLVGISVLFANVVGFTVFVCSVTLYPRLRRLAPAARFAILGVALLAGAAAGTLLVTSLYPLFVLADPRRALALAAVNSVLALVVGTVTYAYEGMRLRLEESLREVEEVRLVEARLQEQAARAELTALQARINPHFFFNTLNTISSLVAGDPDRAEEVVLTLAGLFRYTFKASDATMVRLDEELEFVEGYLAIERARFGDRLRVAWEVDPGTRGALVPGLLLQPLVENAVLHGLAPLPGGATIRIRTKADDGTLVVEVGDDGRGLVGDAASWVREDHALANVRRRLETRYRGAARFTLEPGPGGRGAVSRVELPFTARSEA